MLKEILQLKDTVSRVTFIEGSMNRKATNIVANYNNCDDVDSITITLDGYYTKVTLYENDIVDYEIIDNVLYVTL
jgi:hypothetical protein